MSLPRFPWAEAMTLGLGTLRLPPETFWRMTLPELAAAARALRGNAPAAPDRSDLAALMEAYPD
ncbi:rcc01693 family protein [Parvibaculum sp.]|mgnify:CR=1 FL=1|uniref:rcc01693 family protein n=1 Tax=Parvibaculum sp. TaxID=2024848 RepID=UPI003C7722DD